MSFNKHEDVFELVDPVKDTDLEVSTGSLHSFPVRLDEAIHDEVYEGQWAHWPHKWNPYSSRDGQTPSNIESTFPRTALIESYEGKGKGLPLKSPSYDQRVKPREHLHIGLMVALKLQNLRPTLSSS